MNDLLVQISQALASLQMTVASHTSETKAYLEAGNIGPFLSKWELLGYVNRPLYRLDNASHITELSEESRRGLEDYPAKINRLRDHIDRVSEWNDNPSVVMTFVVSLDAIARGIDRALEAEVPDTSELARQARDLKRITSFVRFARGRVDRLNEQADDLDKKILQIERAAAVANDLPNKAAFAETVAKELAANKVVVDERATEVEALRKELVSLVAVMKASDKEAKQVLAACNVAYSAATSHGLGAAFSERARKLNISMWGWVGGLAVALAGAVWLGAWRFERLIDVLQQPNPSLTLLIVNSAFTVAAVSAPIWFAWLASLQIGYQFRLVEDYSYKASIAKAYEGYRREAAKIDPTLALRLMSTTIGRLDELPIRLVQKDVPGSPLQDLVKSKAFADASKLVPDFATRIEAFARDLLSKTSTAAKSVDKAD